MNLSPNFTLKEFTTSETAMRNGFTENYNPPAEIVENLRKLALYIAEPIRKEWGSFSPTVAYRCKRLNDIVSKAKKSDHLEGKAFDETFLGNKGENICDKVFFWLLKSKVPFTKLIWEKGDDDKPRWLHISYDETKNSLPKEVYYTFDGKNYITYKGSVLEKYHKSIGKI